VAAKEQEMALPVRRREAAPRRVQRWEPFRELEDLQEQMGELMESVLSGTGLPETAVWAPPVDIEETDDAWVIEAEIPGAKREDVHVEARDNELVIWGDIKERERSGVLRRRTRRVGRFEYRVTLPGQLDPDAIEATLGEGVLSVRVPKPAEVRPRQIEVQGDGEAQTGR
jgi:HSP20 family protein